MARSEPSGGGRKARQKETSAKDSEQLADALESLTILDDPKTAMRTVNEALVKLRKAAQDGQSKDKSGLIKTATTASQAIDFLRERCKGAALNTERAAASLCAVLCELNFYEVAAGEITKSLTVLRELVGSYCETSKAGGKRPETATEQLCTAICVPLPTADIVKTAAPDIATLVVQLQTYAVTVILRKLSSECKSTTNSLVSSLSQHGNPLDWHSHTTASTSETMQQASKRINACLEKIFGTITRATNNIDSSTSTIDFEPDSLLRLRLYGVRCVVATPSLSQSTKDGEADHRRDAFWDQSRRILGLYIRAITKLGKTTSIETLSPIVHELFDKIFAAHPQLISGAAFYNVLEDLKLHADTNKDAALSREVAEQYDRAENAVTETTTTKMLRIAKLLDQQRKNGAKNNAWTMLDGLLASIKESDVDDNLEILRGSCYKSYKTLGNDATDVALLVKALTCLFELVKTCSAKAAISGNLKAGAFDSALLLVKKMSSGDKALSLLDGCLSMLTFEKTDEVSPRISESDTRLAKSLASAYYNTGVSIQRAGADEISGMANALQFFQKACEVGRAASTDSPDTNMPKRYMALAGSFESIGQIDDALQACLSALEFALQGQEAVTAETADMVSHYTRLAIIKPDFDFGSVTVHDKVQGVKVSMLSRILDAQCQYLDRKLHKPRILGIMVQLQQTILQFSDNDDACWNYRSQAMLIYLTSIAGTFTFLAKAEEVSLLAAVRHSLGSSAMAEDAYALTLAELSHALIVDASADSTSYEQRLEMLQKSVRESTVIMSDAAQKVRSKDMSREKRRQPSSSSVRFPSKADKTPQEIIRPTPLREATSPAESLTAIFVYQCCYVSSYLAALGLSSQALALLEALIRLVEMSNEETLRICLLASGFSEEGGQDSAKSYWLDRFNAFQQSASVPPILQCDFRLALSEQYLARGNIASATENYKAAIRAETADNVRKHGPGKPPRRSNPLQSARASLVCSRISASNNDWTRSIECGLTAIRSLTGIIHNYARRTLNAPAKDDDIFLSNETPEPAKQDLLQISMQLPKIERTRLLEAYHMLCTAYLHTSAVCAARGSAKMAIFLLEQATIYSAKLPWSIYNTRINCQLEILRRSVQPSVGLSVNISTGSLPFVTHLRKLYAENDSFWRTLRTGERTSALEDDTNLPALLEDICKRFRERQQAAQDAIQLEPHFVKVIESIRQSTGSWTEDHVDLFLHICSHRLAAIEADLDQDSIFSILTDAVVHLASQPTPPCANIPNKKLSTVKTKGNKIAPATHKSKTAKPAASAPASNFTSLNEIFSICTRDFQYASHLQLSVKTNIVNRARLYLAASTVPVCPPSPTDPSQNTTFQREISENLILKCGRPKDELSWPGETLPEPITSGNKALLECWKAISDANAPRSAPIVPVDTIVVSLSIDVGRDRLLVHQQNSENSICALSLPLDRLARREEEDGVFDYATARAAFDDIIKNANASCQRAKHVLGKDERHAWWELRENLDERLKLLLENVEDRWLGAFKSLLKHNIPASVNSETLTGDVYTILKPYFGRNASTKSTTSSVPFEALQILSAMPADSTDEDLEDWLHYVLDSIHLAGHLVNYDEADTIHTVLDLRRLLENFQSQHIPQTPQHIFLALDKHCQCFPWESLPCLQGLSVSRIPSAQFLGHMLRLREIDVASKHNVNGNGAHQPADGTRLDMTRAYYLLNPSGDLTKTQATFEPWLKQHKTWTGLIGKPPMELEIQSALKDCDLFIYFGHGGAEQYIRSRTLRSLPRCAAAFLWGCSSGTLHDQGEFDSYGTPLHYMHAGCPTLVANLWDVTDKDIDKLTQATFTKLGLDPDSAPDGDALTIPQAIANSRRVCTMRYLNGAAPVVYGLPLRCGGNAVGNT